MQLLQRLAGEGRRNQHFHELLAQGFHRWQIHRAIESDDAAKRRGGVGLIGLFVRAQGVVGHRHAAGVGVFDDDASRRVKTLHAFPRGIRIGDVVEGQFFALQLTRCHQGARRGVRVLVEGGQLVRVLAVTQVLQLDEAAIGLAGKQAALLGFQIQGRQVIADGAVVIADAVESGHGELEAGVFAQAAIRLPFVHHRLVLRRVGQHRHVFPIFGGAAHHGGATNVDVFNRVVQAAIGLGHGGFKRVEVDHQQVDGFNAVVLQRLHVLRQVAPRQQAAVHFGVQGFHTAIEHFGKAREVGHFTHRQTLRTQQLRGAPGGNELDAKRVQGLGELHHIGFIGHGNQGIHEASFEGRPAPSMQCS